MPSISISELSDSAADLARLTTFYETLFISGFPDPDERESLENIQAYLQAKHAGWYTSEGPKNNYHILLAEKDGMTVAAVVCDYLAVPNSGIIEFLLVAESARAQGLGWRMHEAVEAILQQDAIAAGHQELDGITIEMNDPYRVEIASDNMDPFVRARLWGGWGYAVLEFPYVQPALSYDQEPVTCLLLCYKRISSRWQTSIAGDIVRQIVHGYLRWAMRIEDPDRDPVFQRMSQSLSALHAVALRPLQHYVGHDPERPLEIVPVTTADSNLFRDVMDIYRQSFPGGATVISPDVFAKTLERLEPGQSRCKYHLWGVQHSKSSQLSGMVSFFTLEHCGFCGYLALVGELSGAGCCRLFLARIEEQLVRDRPGLNDWFLECEPESVQFHIFTRLGFSPVPIAYRQPLLSHIDTTADADQEEHVLTLMRKSVGLPINSGSRSEEMLETQLAEIREHVYGICQ
jgi:hypothetical protein